MIPQSMHNLWCEIRDAIKKPQEICNECPDSIPVKQCAEDGPFEVTITDADTPQITVNTVCLDGTIHNLTFTDGVQTDDTDTGVACDDNTVIDVEYECLESTGTIHAVSFVDGVQTTTVDTGRSCGETSTPRCVKWASVYVGLENTGTKPGDSHTFEITLESGTVVTVVDPGGHANFGAQLDAWAAIFGAAFPGCIVEQRATDGTGGLPLPPAGLPLAGIFKRYLNFTCCPTDDLPVKAQIVGKKSPQKLNTGAAPEQRGYMCVTCEGDPPVLLGEDMQPVLETPSCVFDCAEEIPETPEPSCTTSSLIPVCEIDPGDDSDPDNPIDPSIFVPDLFLQFTTCGTDVTADVYALDGGEPVEAPPLTSGNYYGDCETLEPVEEPIPECPPGLNWEPVNIGGGWYGILDNSLWDAGVAAPFPHLKNGNAYEFTFYDATGAVVAMWQQTGDPYFNNLLQTFGPCSTLPVCANHTSPKGCNPGHVANLAMYPAYDPPTAPGDPQNNVTNPALAELWASGWMFDCSGPCVEPFTRVEITASIDPNWLGVSKDITSYEKPAVLGYRAQDCDNIYFTDCDGNPIAAPGCCPEPWTGEAPASPLEEVIGESCCNIGEEGCAVTEYTQADHTGLSVFDQAGAPAIKTTGITAAHVDVINNAIADDCTFMIKGGDGATFIGDGTTTGTANTAGFVLSNGLATATACDGTALASANGDQPTPSTTTIITYCGKTGASRKVVFTEDKCLADIMGEVLEAMTCAHTECIDPCITGSTYVNGRPPAGQPWAWGPYAGNNLVEFEADLTAAGYTTIQIGEKHQICPPFGSFGEDPNALVVNSVGSSTATVEPNIDPDFVADTKCAMLTVGCNDDRRDDKLDSIIGLLEQLVGCLCGPCCPPDLTGPAGGAIELIGTNQTSPPWPYNASGVGLNDFTIPIELDAAAVTECCATANDATLVTLRTTFVGHEVEGHGGFLFQIPGATSTAVSASNDAAPSGSALQNVGKANASPNDPAGGVDRWVEWTIPLGSLTGGMTLSSFAFGGATANANETLAGFEIEIVSIEGCA